MFPEASWKFVRGIPMLLALGLAGVPAGVAAMVLEGVIQRPDGLSAAALVTLREVDRGIAWTLQSATDGTFRFENLSAGNYRVTARSPGLPAMEKTARGLSNDIRLEFLLSAGSAQEALTTAEMLPFLPERGDGRQLLRFHCVQCHGLELIAGAAKTPELWRQTVQTMAARVPPAPEGEMQRIEDYLAWAFGVPPRVEVPLTGVRNFAFHPDAVMVELDLPKVGAHPHDISLGPDGLLWVADFDVRPNLQHNTLFRVNPETLEIGTVELELATAGVRSIEFDRQGVPWLTVLFGNQLARLGSNGEEPVVYALPQDDFWPHSMAFSADGTAWISGMRADHLAQFDPGSGSFRLVKVPTSNSMLYDVEVDRQGRVWYSGLFAHRLGRYDPASNSFAEYPTPTPLSSTRYLEIGPAGEIWVALFAAGRLGRLDPVGGEFQEIALPDANSSPYDLKVGDSGALWYSDFTRNSVTFFDPASGETREYSIPSSPYARPTEIEQDRNGRLWFCENGAGKVGYVDVNAVSRAGVHRISDDARLQLEGWSAGGRSLTPSPDRSLPGVGSRAGIALE